MSGETQLKQKSINQNKIKFQNNVYDVSLRKTESFIENLDSKYTSFIKKKLWIFPFLSSFLVKLFCLLHFNQFSTMLFFVSICPVFWKVSTVWKAFKLRKALVRNELTLFTPMSRFYTPWKRQKIKSCRTFSGDIEMGYWREKGSYWFWKQLVELAWKKYFQWYLLSVKLFIKISGIHEVKFL